MSETSKAHDPDEIVRHVVDFFNAEFDGIESLGKSQEMFDKLDEKKTDIETKLSIASDEVPSKLSQVLADVDNALKRSKELRTLQSELDNQVSSHLVRVSPIVNDLKQPIEEITYIERCIHYLQWIQTTHNISSEIQTALLVKAESRAINYYCQLINLRDMLKTSKCTHLNHFVKVTEQFWYQLLKEKFTREFEELFKSLRWPFIPPLSMDSLMRPDAEVYSRFHALFSYLIRLQTPSDKASKEANAMLDIQPHFEPLILPLQLLLQPLKKRFKFHFYGKKETNNLEKPEWYFTQILNWIRDHSAFLEEKIQPILNEMGFYAIDAKIEFMRGLVQLVMEKLNSSVEEILYDDTLLSHTIDETFLFDKELRNLGYPSVYPACVSVLTQDQHFTRWINMERNSAVEKMDIIMSTATAWKPRFQDHGEIDEYRVPECGEHFMTLISVITDRYKALPLPGHRLQLLDLQLELLDDFRVRLRQLHREDVKDPFNSNYCPILNTVNYIIHILTEWSDLSFFVQMQYYKLEYEKTSQKLLKSQVSSSTVSTPLDEFPRTSFGENSLPFISGSISTALQKEALESLQEDFDEDKIDSVDGSVFVKITELLEHMKDDMLRKLVEYSISDVKAKSKPYRSEKWFSLPLATEFINLSVSPSACSMLMVLKNELQTLQEILAKNLFSKVWQQIAEELDYFLHHELILRNHFNEGGSAQIHYDMTRNFFPIFGDYTRHPENYFKRLKEATILLTLPKGSGLLLQDVLNSDNQSSRKRESFSENALHELGVYKLDRKDALAILNCRTDLNIL